MPLLRKGLHIMIAPLKRLDEIEARTNLECSIGVNTGTKPCVVLSIEESTFLTQSLRLAVGALGESAKLIHFFPPTHLFQDGSDAHELQSRAIEVYQSHCKALSSIQQLGLGESEE